MALQEIFHVVASSFPIDADDFTNQPVIPGGRLVTLTTSGKVTLQTVVTGRLVGIAGDTKAQNFSSTVRNPESDAIVIGADGGQVRFTQNGVNFNYNDTIGSGKMTVYHGGGEFYTDQYSLVADNGSAQSFVPGAALYSTYLNTPTNQTGGLFTADATGSKEVVGITIEEPSALQSGVPGTDVRGSMSWGTFLRVLLRI